MQLKPIIFLNAKSIYLGTRDITSYSILKAGRQLRSLFNGLTTRSLFYIENKNIENLDHSTCTKITKREREI